MALAAFSVLSPQPWARCCSPCLHGWCYTDHNLSAYLFFLHHQAIVKHCPQNWASRWWMFMTCPVSCSSVREERWEGVPPGRWSMLAGVSGAVQLEGCRILCTVCLSTSYCVLAHPWDRGEDCSPEKQLQWSEILSEVKVELGFESDTEIQLGSP